jgi:hypothetical protein
MIGGVLLMTFKPSDLFGQKLSLRSGVVSGMQKKVEEHITVDSNDVRKQYITYTYIAQFELSGEPFMAKFNVPYKINDGDLIKVSGAQKEDYFEVIAYRNDTQNHTNTSSWWTTALAGLIFAGATVFIYFQLVKEPQWYENIFFLALFGVGVFLMLRGLFIKEAITLLNNP